MIEIDIVRTPTGVVGWTKEDRKQWKRFRKWLEDLGPGECARIGYTKPRNPHFHRKFMAMVRLAFEAWDPASQGAQKTHNGMPVEKNFDRFRKDVLILAGFYESFYDINSDVQVEALSINFDSMDDNEFEKVYTAVAEKLLEFFLTRYDRATMDHVIEQLTRFADGDQ